MDKHWDIKRKIQSKEEERNLLAIREIFEILEQKNEKGQEEWNSEMQSKIKKDIMTPIDTIRRILIDREKWVTEMLGNSQETIWTISKKEMIHIIRESSNTGLPQIPAGDKSLHFLDLEDI